MSYTLTSGSTTKTLAAWGISNLRRRRSSQALDLVTFALDGSAYDGAAPFAASSEIVITRDATTWFRGRVVGLRREGQGSAQAIFYEVSGPWWYLERLVYQQPWAIQGSADTYKSHCLLNLTVTGSVWTTRDQIDDALDWCSDKAADQYGSAPFQWTKANLPQISIPSDEVRDITCAEVIRKQLRWMPDAVAWWDYSTNPPTFHCKRRADLSTASVTIGTGVSAVRLVPRYDLQVPAVALKFEQINTVNGVSLAAVTTQVYPGGSTGEEFGALVGTIDLAGGTVTYATAYVRTTALPTTNADWWTWLKTKHPWLGSARVALDTVLDVDRTVSGAGDPLDYELLDGQIPPWAAASSQHETVTIAVRIHTYAADETTLIDSKEEVFTVNIVTTDVATTTFSSLQEFVAGESVPSGLAEALYNALSPLEWEGQIQIVGSDCDGTVEVGDKLNLSGGHSDWSSMAAVVQQTDEDLETGTTTIAVGPPQHLGARDMIELLRVNRYRLVITPAAARTGGTVGGGAVALGSATPQENATSGIKERHLLRLRGQSDDHLITLATSGGPSITLTPETGSAEAVLAAASLSLHAATGTGEIILDTADADGEVIQLREVSVCVNGEEKRMLLLCSEPYDPPA